MGLDPAIQAVSSKESMRRTAAIFGVAAWMAGSSPAMTQGGDFDQGRGVRRDLLFLKFRMCANLANVDRIADGAEI